MLKEEKAKCKCENCPQTFYYLMKLAEANLAGAEFFEVEGHNQPLF